MWGNDNEDPERKRIAVLPWHMGSHGTCHGRADPSADDTLNLHMCNTQLTMQAALLQGCGKIP